MRGALCKKGWDHWIIRLTFGRQGEDFGKLRLAHIRRGGSVVGAASRSRPAE